MIVCTPFTLAQYYYQHEEFCMGADLSYVNHIQDKGAVWREKGELRDPYQLFMDHGGNCARFRLWHTPAWTMQVYIDAGEEATQMYHDYMDVKRAIMRSKAAGLAVCLDFHYSDFWADPGKQYIPAAWEGLAFQQVRDSLYDYTFRTLTGLDQEGLMPEYIQVGNEINAGFIHPAGRISDNEANLAILLNTAIDAVRDAGAASSVNPEIIIHIAQPENVDWWFDDMLQAGLTGFDIIGFSYYAQWSDVRLGEISENVSRWKQKYNKKIMCVETSYPRELTNAVPGQEELLQIEPDFYPSVQAQKNYLITLTQEIIDGGGCGLIPWEPFWVPGHRMIDAWGIMGSHRGNSSWFDYSEGNEVQPSIDFLNYSYTGISGTFQPRDSVEVTIHLNGGGRIVSDRSVYIEGSLTDDQQVVMTAVSDTSWSYTCRLPEGSFHLFRFYYGDRPDSIPENFRVGNIRDRAISIPDSQVIFSYTWNGAIAVPVPDSVNITFQVDMRGLIPAPEGVYIYGNFFDAWGPRMLMIKICDSVWIKTLMLASNREYWFRFFNGYAWENSEVPPAECRVGDKNRLFITPGHDAGFIFKYNICGQTECDTCGHAICDVVPTDRSFMSHDSFSIRILHDNWKVRAIHPAAITSLMVYNMYGRLIFEHPSAGQSESIIDISSWNPGIYLISFSDQWRTVATKKITIIR